MNRNEWLLVLQVAALAALGIMIAKTANRVMTGVVVEIDEVFEDDESDEEF